MNSIYSLILGLFLMLNLVSDVRSQKRIPSEQKNLDKNTQKNATKTTSHEKVKSVKQTNLGNNSTSRASAGSKSYSSYDSWPVQGFEYEMVMNDKGEYELVPTKPKKKTEQKKKIKSTKTQEKKKDIEDCLSDNGPFSCLQHAPNEAFVLSSEKDTRKKYPPKDATINLSCDSYNEKVTAAVTVNRKRKSFDTCEEAAKYFQDLHRKEKV